MVTLSQVMVDPTGRYVVHFKTSAPAAALLSAFLQSNLGSAWPGSAISQGTVRNNVFLGGLVLVHQEMLS